MTSKNISSPVVSQMRHLIEMVGPGGKPLFNQDSMRALCCVLLLGVVQQSGTAALTPEERQLLQRVLREAGVKRGAKPAELMVALKAHVVKTVPRTLDLELRALFQQAVQEEGGGHVQMGALSAPQEGESKSAIITKDAKAAAQLKQSLERSRQSFGAVRANNKDAADGPSPAGPKKPIPKGLTAAGTRNVAAPKKPLAHKASPPKAPGKPGAPGKPR
jgi:hypothetical protein